MTEHPAAWLLAIGGGGLVAVAYFASLWWTLQGLQRARRPALLVAGSYLLRAPLAALALWGAATGDALRLGASALAFLLVRVVLTGIVRRGPARPPAGLRTGPLSGKP